jgi:hypothetical protein
MFEIPNDPFDQQPSASTSTAVVEKVSPQLCQVQNEALHKMVVRASVMELSESFALLDDMSEGIYSLSRYVPKDAKQLPVWRDDILPAMSGGLVQYVKINNAFRQTLGTIRSAAITLRQTSDLVMRNQGDNDSINIAAQELGRVFDQLDVLKDNLQKLDLKMLAAFERNAQVILYSIMGSDVAESWTRQINALRDEVDTYRQKVVRIENEQAKLVGEIQGLHEYLVSLRTLVGEKAQATAEMTSRLQALQRDIEATNQRMDSIPTTVTVTEQHTYGRGWWFWRRSHTVNIQRQVKNPNRESEVAFLQSVVNSRFATLNQITDLKQREEAQRAALEKEKRDVTDRLAEKEAQLKSFFEGGAKFQELAAHLTAIEHAQARIKAIEEEAHSVETTYGLRGDVLLRFLVEARLFLRKTQGQAQAITPLIVLIDNIQSYFRTNLSYFQLEAKKEVKNKHAIMSAGQAMLREIGLLDSCALALPLLTAPPQERQGIIEQLRNFKEEEAKAIMNV